ncbi:MAG: aminotransferase class V-fold PLP-dependent enzyme [Acidobacteriota bacterium]
MSIYRRLGVRTVINGRSYSTKVGGCLMAPEVLAVMQEASRSFVRIEDLQEAASGVIASATGAEAGMVTSGAAAALTLAAAACLAGLNTSRMNALPDTAGLRNQIVIQRLHRNDYDRALRVAGAEIAEVGYNYVTFPYELEDALSDRTAAVFFLAGFGNQGLPLTTVTEIAHRKGVPVIVDAAADLPPRENLRKYLAEGADLVAFSGGKHIQGPQSTGILCGKKPLILSAILQQQDMDVFPETWPFRHLIAEGVLKGPPHHGLGRGFKAAKEEIAGLITALQLYQKRDLQAELQLWKDRIQAIVSGLERISGIETTHVFPSHGGRPVPEAQIQVDSLKTGLTAWDVINALQEGDPIIAVYESLAASGRLVIFPETLQEGDPERIVQRLKEVLSARRG